MEVDEETDEVNKVHEGYASVLDEQTAGFKRKKIQAPLKRTQSQEKEEADLTPLHMRQSIPSNGNDEHAQLTENENEAEIQGSHHENPTKEQVFAKQDQELEKERLEPVPNSRPSSKSMSVKTPAQSSQASKQLRAAESIQQQLEHLRALDEQVNPVSSVQPPPPSSQHSNKLSSLRSSRAKTQKTQQSLIHHPQSTPQTPKNQQLDSKSSQKLIEGLSSGSDKGELSQLPRILELQTAVYQRDERITQLMEELRSKDAKHEEEKSQMKSEVEGLLVKVAELERLLRERENDLEQYRNGNQTLHLQDVSAISVHNHLKSNQNEPKKDLTIFEVLNEKHSTADLSELGQNFWLIGAERRIQQSNPLYKDFVPKVDDKKKSVNIPTKRYEKSYWFKYVDIRKKIQLPKLPEVVMPIMEEPKPPAPAPIPYSQKLHASNQNLKKSSSSVQKSLQQMYNSQPSIRKREFPTQFDPDDFLAEQELEKLFKRQGEVPKPQINWAESPQNHALLMQHTNSSQVLTHLEKYPMLSQKQSYEHQYAHKKEMQYQLNESQNQTRQQKYK